MSLSASARFWLAFTGAISVLVGAHKTRVLDEFCATCGYHRKAALRLLNQPLPGTSPSTATAVLVALRELDHEARALRETVAQTSAKA